VGDRAPRAEMSIGNWVLNLFNPPPELVFVGDLMLLLLCAAFATVGSEGPCDLTESGGNPCVAAHSTVRALYEAYDGE
jgi:hypothetical protein